ncbi:MAG: hypothetical protein ACE5J9_09765, partial [Methanosarcinales archaeon]
MRTNVRAIAVLLAFLMVIALIMPVLAATHEKHERPIKHEPKKPMKYDIQKYSKGKTAQSSRPHIKPLDMPSTGGNLEYAPMYLDGTESKILITNCPECMSFDWFFGSPSLYGYIHEGGEPTFTVTFRNGDTISHTLNFTYSSGDIAGTDTSINPNSVNIPAGGTATVEFSMDLSNTANYPVIPYDDWYDYYYADFKVDYDGSYATDIEFEVAVLPPNVNLPNIWLWDVDLENQYFEFQNMKIYASTYGYGWSDLYYLEDLYLMDDFWDDMYVYDIYDEIGNTSEWYTMEDSELKINSDGSVEMIDHATFDTLTVEWHRTWKVTPDDWWVKTEDTFINTGTDPVSFSMSTYIDNYADDYTAIKVPWVYDSWTPTDIMDP